MAYRHIVLFRVRDDVPEEHLRGVVDVLASFVFFPGVTTWSVERSLDERKGRIIVQDGTFESRAAFDHYRLDATHQRAGEMMAAISDWWVGDYET